MKKVLLTCALLSTASAYAMEMPSVAIGGYVETEMGYSNTEKDGEKAANTLEIGEAALEFEAKANEYVTANAVLMYNNDDALFLDVASASYEKGNLFAKAGLDYAKFGQQESSLVADPSTLELGELQETLVEAGYIFKGVEATVYGFRPGYEYNENSGYAYGADARYTHKLNEEDEISFGASYVSNINDSAEFEAVDYDADTHGQYNKETSAYAIFGNVSVKSFGLKAEYMKTSKQVVFDGTNFSEGKKAEALQVEASYGFTACDYGMEAIVAYNTKDRIGDYETRYSAGLGLELDENNAFTFEYFTQESADKIDTNGASLLYAVTF